ncbi:family 12 glycosyl hydrolase [Xylaria bambusicola]|uniref:family 12 glycosyl hydrolase n=1 Tax=Xylaria bambusicola TaxID=326684 RepID=UPI002007AE86|nr:family 12 glycosyl hydrolase [Xylaria bambusicola]KAI0517311.1 family 12 glycosyl hydrolase [Xylaria bambusicola]
MKSFILAALAGLALATPTPTVDKRATTFCGQWDSAQTGSYIVYNNLWGASSGTGKQCTTVNGLSSNSVAWSTSWSWSGGNYNVKSYANAVVQTSAKRISAISSIPTTWKYTYTGSNMVANVAYDVFTSSSSSGSSEYEIMVWLAALGGAGPISSTGSPIATPTVGGVSWKLYEGYNGAMHVFSFVASSQVTNFSGDLKNFLTYLNQRNGLSTSQYVTSIGAGTEPFVGSNAVLTTSAYSITVN